MAESHIQIGDISPRIQYTADGAQTVFTYPFPVFTAADMEVYLDAAEQVGGFTVNGAGASAGGDVTFDTAPASGTLVTLRRRLDIRRTSDFQESGEFRAKVINDELDYQTAALQQVAADQLRTLRQSATDADDIAELPDRDTRADNHLAFDANGDPIASEGPSEIPVSAAMAPVVQAASLATARTAMGLGALAEKDTIDTAEIAGLAVTAAKIAAGAVTDAKVADSVPQLGKNAIANGSMRVAQQGTSFTAASTPANNDDTYLLDQIVLLSDGNDIVDVSQDTTVRPDGAYASMKALVATANKKFGFLFPVEARDAARFRGKTASVQFKARTTTGAVIENVRAALLSWDGTADSITSDVVSAWNAEDADPTFAANWTAENTPANIAVAADSFATHAIEGISVDTSGMTNLALFIWVDDTDAAANDVLYIADVQVEFGDAATDFEVLPYSVELVRCQRYYQVGGVGWNGFTPDTPSQSWFSGSFHTAMRAAPSVTLLDASPTIQHATTTATGSSSSVVGSYLSPEGGAVALDGFTGLTVTEPCIVAQTGEIFGFSARL